MDGFETADVPHRPVPYHPAIVPAKPTVHAAAVPPTHVRDLDGPALYWRTIFWVGLGGLSVGTTAFAAMLALGQV